MTPAQTATVKAAIIADPTASAIRTSGDVAALQAWCNTPTATKAWRTSVPGAEVYRAHKQDEYINRSVPERGAFDLMCLVSVPHDFTTAQIRSGVANIFSGTTQNTSRTAIFTVAQEGATNAQLAIGGTNASVGNMTGMSETVTALVRNFSGQVTLEEASLMAN